MTPFPRAICRRHATERCSPPLPSARLVWRSLLPLMIMATPLVLAGCASPGLPHPPSLMLPARVSDLRAERVGDAVLLHWTSPSETTDHVALRGWVSAELCRDPLPAGVPGQQAAAPALCTVVATVSSPAGARSATDPLPASLLGEPAQALAYRVRLLNAGGHNAGASDAVLVASGAAPPAVPGLQARPARDGVTLSWMPRNPGPESAVELVRSAVPAQAGPAPHHGLEASGSFSRPNAAPVRLLAVPPGTPDPGGAVDPTAERDHTYVYRAVRVRTVTVGGATLTLRSADSASVTVLARDVAPPAAPTQLVLATDGLSADLSWQPGFEPDLAGYVVYRTEPAPGGTGLDSARWERLTPTPVQLPAFHDTLPHTGHFAYRVTAVDRSGNESAASAPALAEANGMDR